MSDSDQNLDGTKVFSDTHPDIERKMIALIRTLTPAQKLAKIGDMGRFVKGAAFATTRLRYPEETDREIMLRVVSRSIPADLMLKAYGWDVREKGF
ncbi:MAG TPA: hypothetical protein VKT77_13665 [Chthonomonadaceae bacterium]|nr:hypothetical protein [Chthonomonadaceae bacterium]